MRINVSIELRRPRRVSMAAGVAALVLLTPAVVLADHRFNDVPTDHPFHDQIDAIANAGITSGFPDGGYHPSEPVTRQAMAAFMQRGFSRSALAVGVGLSSAKLDVPAGVASTELVPVRELTIVVPGASNRLSPRQLVYLHGRVAFWTSMHASKGCPCQFGALLVDTATDETSYAALQTFESTSTGRFTYSFDIEGLFSVEPGERTFRLDVGLSHRNDWTNPASFDFYTSSSLGAMTAAFDASPTPPAP